jgi:hypothetical protein
MQMLGVRSVCIGMWWSILQLGLYIAVMFLCWAAHTSLCFTMLCVLLRAEGSGEEHRYAGALLKEKRAFESLIATKEHMVRLPHNVFPLVRTSALPGCVVLQVISLPDHPEDVQQESKADKLLLSMDTRTLNRGSSSSSSSRAGGKRGVVVDVRDFRSTLPSALYVSGEVSCLALHTVCGVWLTVGPRLLLDRCRYTCVAYLRVCACERTRTCTFITAC